MNDIIEKLGLKTPDELKVVQDVWKVYELAGLPRVQISNDFSKSGEKIKKILDDKNELLEVLIDEIINQEKVFMPITCKRMREAVENTTGRKWKDIQELIK